MRAVSLALCVMMVSAPAWALPCKPKNVNADFVAQYDVIVEGTAAMSNVGALAAAMSAETPVEFTVINAWKGATPDAVITVQLRGKGVTSAYKSGKNYFVFAKRDGEELIMRQCKDDQVRWPDDISPQNALDGLLPRIKPSETKSESETE